MLNKFQDKAVSLSSSSLETETTNIQIKIDIAKHHALKMFAAQHKTTISELLRGHIDALLAEKKQS